MLTQAQIDAIAQAVIDDLKKMPSAKKVGTIPLQQAVPDALQKTNMRKLQDKAVEASEVIPLNFIPKDAKAGTAGNTFGGKRMRHPVKDVSDDELVDITAPEIRTVSLLDHIEDPDGLERMMKHTSARIGVGSCGARLRTQTMLTLRADHAAARDAVFKDVSQALLDRMHLFTVTTCCTDKDNFLKRPDMGRIFPESSLRILREKCRQGIDVQIYASDGLSSTAIEANLENILPIIMEGLEAEGLSVGTPFFVKNGRVAAMDQISETLGAKVTCVLIGERPGLATAESMSAYIAYKASVGMPEARRTVVSNIHRRGIPAVEAGAYIVDVIKKILEAKASGVELRK